MHRVSITRLARIPIALVILACTPWVAHPSAPSATRQRISIERLRELPVQRLFLGRYFVDVDSSDVLIVIRKGEDLRLESPGEWTGTGTVRGNTYRGGFLYGRHARDPRNRGARGTHVGTLQLDGVMRVTGTFTNRDWPPFRVTWTPSDAGLRFRPPAQGVPRVDGAPPRESGRIEHPVWPPESRPTPEHSYEHPIWPPEWSKGDSRIVLARAARTDSLPTVIRRVEPR